ncbi:ROK family protein [Marinilactibacillus kalidii]|uniref:ROK family protein n=1 Tax=Marinilactibacillus kalidii TaxID=2820274 RepID=UPI001ABE879D|nr:ROK family protein [Marinilactibacillus kalidii]
MIGAIEAGGTKFVCAISDDSLTIQDRMTIPTTTPDETLGKVFAFFDQYELSAIGIGSFGPIGVNKESDSYGFVTTTPKTAWKNTDFLGRMKARYNIPIGWTTDVNAAALGELEAGAAKGLSSCVYLTVGTGIGGGAVVDGKPLEGFGHPEMGHVLVKLHPEDSFEGVCPYHGNCLEGLAAGPAIEKRYGDKAQNLSNREEVWTIQAYYIAQALMNYTLILSPEKIILGGGVMKQKQLFPLIRSAFKTLLNDYVETPDLESYITSPDLGDDAGITGSLILAMNELKK